MANPREQQSHSVGHDVLQWLTAIEVLKAELARVQQERNIAQARAVNWSRLYETEAQQRRTDAWLAEKQIRDLRAALQQRQQLLQDNTCDRTEVEAEIAQLPSGQAVWEKLIDVWLERDRLRNEVERLTEALKTEQTNHEQTRQDLTVALADALELLNQERNNGSPRNTGSDISP